MKVKWKGYIQELIGIEPDKTISEKIFIEKFEDKVDWDCISIYQKLSKVFRKRHKIEISETNWLYKTAKEKLKAVQNTELYEIVDGKIIAYKSVRNDNYSCFNFQYKYDVGQEYESQCDCNIDNDNSFGLSAWTKEAALDYNNKGKLLKVEIKPEWLGCIVRDGNKLRCWRLKVLEEVK